MDEKALSEILECSVCLDGLDGSSKVLPCQHTFCRRCLEEIIAAKKELRCPECRTLVEIPIEELPMNVLLVRLLEGMKNAKSGINHSVGSLGHAEYRQLYHSGSHGSNSRSSRSHKNSATSQPHAKALYNYEGTEPGDLSFKKGDVILLRKQVDENWYHGELSNQHGFFPATYVQVIMPLPQEIPKCKALYDFDLDDQQEKDCLTFKKDEVVTVIRRIDDNWAEGKLGERIGIFPISFVEMNDAAKWLINNQTAGELSARLVPAGSNQSANNNSSRANNNVNNMPPGGVSSLATRADNNLMNQITSYQPISPILAHPASIMTTGMISTPLLATSLMSQSMMGTPLSANNASTSLNTQMTSHRSNSKRHSLTTYSPQHQHQQQSAPQRHSMEISPTTVALTSAVAMTTGTNSPGIPIFPISSVPHLRTATAAASLDDSQTSAGTSSSAPLGASSPEVASTAASSELTQNAVQGQNSGEANLAALLATGPAIYIALYNYKPRKQDEIELKKGECYALTERCQDGWFKGICLRSHTMGVFPGNYVQLVKPKLPPSVNRSGYQPSTSQHTVIFQTPSSKQVNVSRAYSFPKTSPLASHDYGRALIPGVTVTSAITSSTPAASHRFHKNGPSPRPQLGISHLTSTVASSTATSVASTSAVSRSPYSAHKREVSTPQVRSVSQASTSPTNSSTALSTPNIVVGATAGEVQLSSREKREKREREKLSLVRRLTKSKKSKSPPPEGAEAEAVRTHKRTGSLPAEPEGASAVAAACSTSVTPQHHKSRSTDGNLSKPKSTKPLVREKFRCIVPYPPQSEAELELKLGDLVYVHRKREDGWFKGTLQRTGKSGLFPCSFVEAI